MICRRDGASDRHSFVLVRRRRPPGQSTQTAGGQMSNEINDNPDHSTGNPGEGHASSVPAHDVSGSPRAVLPRPQLAERFVSFLQLALQERIGAAANSFNPIQSDATGDRRGCRWPRGHARMPTCSASLRPMNFFLLLRNSAALG